MGRLGSPDFSPRQDEKFFPFSYTFASAGGEVIRQGRGFVLVSGPLWCLVRSWSDPGTGNPGRRLLIVDRSQARLAAVLRRWPEGSRGRRWNHWSCIRNRQAHDMNPDLYLCEYHYPEETVRLVQTCDTWPLYQDFTWHGSGLLKVVTRFRDSHVRYHYDGLKVKRIEYSTGGTLRTFAEFTYQ